LVGLEAGDQLLDFLVLGQAAARVGDGLARIPHKPVEQMGGRGVRELENTELYDDPFYRPESDRL
jgi:hypothetical protein